MNISDTGASKIRKWLTYAMTAFALSAFVLGLYAGIYTLLDDGGTQSSQTPYLIFGGFLSLALLWSLYTLHELHELWSDLDNARAAIHDWRVNDQSEGLTELLSGRLIRQNGDGEQPELTDVAYSLDRDTILKQANALAVAGRGQLPSFFTGLGIIFTFLGLIIGLSEANLAAVSQGGEALESLNLQNLLNGVGLAFRSSFVGVGCSIVLSAVLRLYDAGLESAASSVQEAAVKKDWGDAPGQVLQSSDQKLEQVRDRAGELVDITKAQKAAIGELGTDIKTAFEQALAEQLEAKVGAPLAAMDEKLGSFTEAQIETQQEAMNAALETFQEQFSDNLTKQFEQLEEALNKNIEWQRQTQQVLDNAISEAQSVLDRMEQHQQRLTELTNRRETLLERRQQTEEMHRSLVANWLEKLEEAVAALESSQEELNQHSAVLEPLISQTESATEHLRSGVKALESAEQNLESTTTRTAEILENAPEQLRKSVRTAHDELEAGLTETFEFFDEETAQVAKHLSGTHTNIESLLEELQEISSDLQKTLQSQVAVTQQLTSSLQQPQRADSTPETVE